MITEEVHLQVPWQKAGTAIELVKTNESLLFLVKWPDVHECNTLPSKVKVESGVMEINSDVITSQNRATEGP